jgi:hypothetical protein
MAHPTGQGGPTKENDSGLSFSDPRQQLPPLTTSLEDMVQRQIHRIVTALEAPGKSTDVPRLFSELRASLSALPADRASALIRGFLDSRSDAPSGLGFKIGADGLLEESPSLRVFLLDHLARVDAAAAASYAEKILGKMSSPDEWAVALRNYARVNSTAQDRTFLEQKLQAMLQHEPWREQPSAGFLEAFDVAVYLGGTNLIPALTTLVRGKENRAVSHAAHLALDRLAIVDATGTLKALQSDPESMKGREVTRANYFARADVSDGSQRGVLEMYLLNPGLNATELSTFAGLFPNANYMISHNLLTQSVVPDHATLVQRDRAALRTVQEWLSDPRFEEIKPQLLKIQKRLEMFVEQPDGSR